jgi:subtilase family serine protease
MQKVSDWLTSQGFTVTEVAHGGLYIRFTGTVGMAQNAFHTQIHRMTLDGETHFANVTEPSVPAAIATVTAAITGLHDFRLKPHHTRIIPGEGAGVTTDPAYTSAATGNHFIAPGDFYTIYDENAALTSGIKGTGITVAVMGQTDISLPDVANFRSVAGLTVNPPTVKIPTGQTDPGTSSADLLEAMLDVEWSGATAPGATILYVNSRNVIDGSLTQAINDPTIVAVAPILSVSYGTCEANVGQAGLTYYSALAQQANAQGQTIVAAAGDSGATDCDYHATTAVGGLAVDFPAAIPSVTGIGGTMFNEGTGTYWGPNNGAAATALSYIPEMAWNEDSTTNGIGSGGGGTSAYFTKPYWQVGTGVPADSARDVPDVSLSAASGHDGYLLCSAGFCTDGWKNSAGSHDVVGGTSVGAPSFAGLMALVEQKIGSRVGNANPILYALANSSFGAAVFHDVTVGNNSSPCNAGATGCPAGVAIGYNAGVGYDRATGLGTLDVFNLVNDWALVTPLVSTTG